MDINMAIITLNSTCIRLGRLLATLVVENLLCFLDIVWCPFSFRIDSDRWCLLALPTCHGHAFHHLLPCDFVLVCSLFELVQPCRERLPETLRRHDPRPKVLQQRAHAAIPRFVGQPCNRRVLSPEESVALAHQQLRRLRQFVPEVEFCILKVHSRRLVQFPIPLQCFFVNRLIVSAVHSCFQLRALLGQVLWQISCFSSARHVLESCKIWKVICRLNVYR